MTSSRMGRPKALLHWDLVGHLCATLDGLKAGRAVVSRNEQLDVSCLFGSTPTLHAVCGCRLSCRSALLSGAEAAEQARAVAAQLRAPGKCRTDNREGRVKGLSR